MAANKSHKGTAWENNNSRVSILRSVSWIAKPLKSEFIVQAKYWPFYTFGENVATGSKISIILTIANITALPHLVITDGNKMQFAYKKYTYF